MQPNQIQQEILKRQEEGLPIVNLSFADFTCFDPLLTRRKIQNSFINIFKYPYYYPTAKGEDEALDAITQYYKRKGREVDPESILLTSTNNQSYLYLLKMFTADGGEVLVPTPNLHSLDEVAGFLDLELKRFPLLAGQGWQIDLDGLEKSINQKTRAIFLMSPHLPTGAIQTEETLQKLLKLIKGKNIVLIMDESLGDFVFNKKKLPKLEQFTDDQQMIVFLNSLTNNFGLPGLKISWMQVEGPAEETDQFLQAVEYLADTFLTLNQLSQTVLPEIIKYSRHWRKKFQKNIEKNRDIVVGKLSKSPRLKFHYPEGGFFTLIEVLPPPTIPENSNRIYQKFSSDEQFVVELLRSTGVYVHPGYYYQQKTGCYFMICFLQDHNVLRSSLKKIVNFLKPKKA